MKKLINEVDNVVTEQLEGLSFAHPELNFSQEPRYIWRESTGKVALISGGGSGHEPLHAGFVGRGMLTGVCPGEVFTSPTPDQMIECAMTVNHDKGVLFFVKNYTGDILNFETAVELLHGKNIKVGAVIIDDDVAIRDARYTAGRRGIAAIVLIEKIVGAAAEKRYSLEECEAIAQKLNNCARSFSIALSACVIPTSGKLSFTLENHEIEFGVGIHGEKGIDRREYKDVDTVVEQIFTELLDYPLYTRKLNRWDREAGNWIVQRQTTEAFNRNDKLIVLINGLGATPISELYGVFRKVHKCCEQQGFSIARNLIGNYCTSLNMEGFSITLLKVDEKILELWDAPVNTPSLRWEC